MIDQEDNYKTNVFFMYTKYLLWYFLYYIYLQLFVAKYDKHFNIFNYI